MTEADKKAAIELGLIIGDGGIEAEFREDVKKALIETMLEEDKRMNVWKERYLELVKMIKEEHHWAAKTGMILANETNSHFSSNVEADNFLRGVSYVTLELTKKIKEMEKEDENDTAEL